MQFNVPQFIDIEDKIVGPLTAKQLGWLAMGGVILLILFGMLDTSAFFLSAVVVGGIFGALAFYRPYNQPLIKFAMSSVVFVFRPKIYIWKRLSLEIKNFHHLGKSKKERVIEKKTANSQKIEEIADLLGKGRLN